MKTHSNIANHTTSCGAGHKLHKVDPLRPSPPIQQPSAYIPQASEEITCTICRSRVYNDFLRCKDCYRSFDLVRRPRWWCSNHWFEPSVHAVLTMEKLQNMRRTSFNTSLSHIVRPISDLNRRLNGLITTHSRTQNPTVDRALSSAIIVSDYI